MGKGMVPPVQSSINCGLGSFQHAQNILSLLQQPILQLVENCTCGTLPFHLYGPTRRLNSSIMVILLNLYKIQMWCQIIKINTFGMPNEQVEKLKKKLLCNI